MKKIFILLILVLTSTVGAWCATDRNNSSNDSVISVVIDYEHGTYVDFTYMQVQQEEPTFLDQRELFAAKFMEGVAENYKGGMRVLGEGVEPNGDGASLTITINYVDEDGIIEVIMEYQKGKEYHRRNIRSEYSVFGTWVGNFGDGMKSVGEKAGEWLASGLK